MANRALNRMPHSEHNYLQKRKRLLIRIRDASTAYLWYMNIRTPQGRRVKGICRWCGAKLKGSLCDKCGRFQVRAIGHGVCR